MLPEKAISGGVVRRLLSNRETLKQSPVITSDFMKVTREGQHGHFSVPKAF